MIKKILLALAIIALALGAVGCSKNYEPVESTAEEKTVLITFSYEGERYELTYELYRALFLNNQSLVDGGDKSVWSGEQKDKYIAEIDAIIIRSAAEIFSTLHHARKIGIDPYSLEIEDEIYEYVKMSVDGYSDENGAVEGFGGDYQKYLDSLTAMNLNYSVQALIYRYHICREKIDEYYLGSYDNENPTPGMQEGKLKYTDDDLKSFYQGDDCVRVLLVTLDTRSYKESRAQEIRDKIASLPDEKSIREYVMPHTLSTEYDFSCGVLIGRYSLDPAYFSELTADAFSLEIGEVGQVVKVTTLDREDYYILYRIEKNSTHFDENKTDVILCYGANYIGNLLNAAKEGIIENAKSTQALDTLNRGEIKMP